MILTKTQRILFEVIFFLLLYFLVQHGDAMYGDSDDNAKLYFFGMFNFFILYGHAAVNRFFIFKYLYPQKKYSKFIGWSLLNILLFALLLQKLNESTAGFVSKELIIYFQNYTLYHCALDLVLGFILMTGIEFLFQFLKIVEEKNQKEKLLHILESQNLKSQLNPHFLFNSLNNAYGLTLSNPNLAADYIMSLSQLMRYQIESIKSETVALSEEIDFISNFLEVEQIRIGQRCSIAFHQEISKEFQKELVIAPLIFLPFIENAVKHGTNTIDDCAITITIRNHQNNIQFSCLNSVPVRKIPTQNTETGLANAKSRLAITYPKHELKISEANNQYLVQLNLNLTSTK